MSRSGVRSPGSGEKSKARPKTPTRSSKPKTSKPAKPGLRTPKSGFRTVVIGYGNPLRSDDGFGWRAAKLLTEVLSGWQAEIITCHQLTPELAEPLSRATRAVFIDADVEGPPGSVRHQIVRPRTPSPSAFTHTCAPADLLYSAQELYGHHPEALIISVSAQSFDFADSLSPAVSAALPKVIRQICQWLGLRG